MANYISGMASGIDWTSMVSQMMELEHRPIDLMEADKDDLDDRKNAWSQVNTKLLSLKTAVSAMSEQDDFDLYTPSASITGTTQDVDDFLSYAVGSTASQGSYTIKIDNLAQAQKLGSRSFASTSDALNLEGDILINSSVVNIVATDSLLDIQGKINAINSGEDPAKITASIFTADDGEYRLTITAQDTGSDGIDIANASSQDILSQLGIADDAVSLNNSITGGAQSSIYTSSTQDIETLLSLNSPSSGNVTIAGESIAIDLSSDSLQSIRDTINNNANLQALGVSASVVSDTSSSTTTYTLQIDGTQTMSDTNNILQTLGFLRQGHSAVSGVTGDASNTANGETITEDTLIADIDGYNTWTSGDTITIEGADHDGVGVGPTDFTITSTSTMDDLLDAIETAFGSDVNAYVDGDGAIVVEDNQAGTSNLALTLTPAVDDGNSTLGFGSFASSTVRQRQITEGLDAQITLDGVSVTRSTNQITDVISGVTLDLVNEDEDAEITLNITRDYDGVKEMIGEFISSYNDVISYVNAQHVVTQNDDESVDTPPLFGDSSLLSVKSSIRDVVLSQVAGLESSFDRLSYIGISIDKEGLLSMNDSTMDDYLQTNFSDVVNLFIAQGNSTDSNLSYVGSGVKTQEGSYEVEITQAATQASTTGVGFSGTLSEAATITITSGTSVAEVSLSAGWNISSIVNAINSELSEEYEEIRIGSNAYYADALQASPITEDTTWNSVYDAVGVSAGLSDSDTISFSGLKRNGVVVNGEYTIEDAGSDTVADLLTQIEEDFGSGYDAYIDSQGRIAINDTTVGESSLSLTITPVENLDFGEIGVTEDGSQEGRYSIGVSAVSDGGQLKLYSDSYGDDSFDVAVSAGNLGITDGTYTGDDVAGRIREEGASEWQTMTGQGQSLTVDDDQDVEGLVVQYTGTATGILDFDFITGIGEKLDNTLYYMTDQFDGYVATKQDSLQDRMDSIDARIRSAETRLDKRQEIMMNKFIMMERLVSQMQSQMQWLNGQISSLSGTS